MNRRSMLLIPVLILLASCASLSGREPLQVTVSGVEPLQGEGMELRMMVKLRVQNPNDSPIDYNGVSVNIDVQGNTFATGVSDAVGTVPRFGEAVIEVPVSASAMRMARQMLGVFGGGAMDKMQYEMTGKLHGTGFGSTRFTSKGEFALPAPGSNPDGS